jgi:Flp pilus assembly protein TadD
MRHWVISCFLLLCLAVTGIACHPDTADTPAVKAADTILPPPLAVPAPTSPLPAALAGSPSLSGQPPETPTPDYTAAKRDIETTIKAKPKSIELRMQAAEFYMKAGDYGAALPHLRAATALSPKLPLPWIALGDAATLERRFDEGAQAYHRAAILAPNDPQIVRGLGQMFVLQRKWKEAQAVLEKGVARHPDDAEIRTVLGNLYLILNKPRRAAAVIKPALEQQPDRADLHYMLGEAYERDLHIEAAIQEMRETVRLDPYNAEAWGRIGLYENNLTRYTEARDPLQHAIALSPKEPHYYWALGDSYLLESTAAANFDRAAELYRKALSLDNGNEKALYSFGMALTRRGRPEDLQEAVKLFQRLLQRKPNDINAHYKLAETYRRLGQDKAAAAEQAKFQDLYSKGRHQTRQLYAAISFKDTADAHLKLAQQAMAQKDYPLAVTEFQLALTRDSHLAEARSGLQQARQKASAAKGNM